MKKNIITIAGILCMTISCAFAETECTFPLETFKQYARATGNKTYCDPSNITKVHYYSYVRGWMIFGPGGINKCQYTFKTLTETEVNNLSSCKDSVATVLSNGVPYACISNSDCDTINGWECKDINPTQGVGVCTQTSCGSNCQTGYGAWLSDTGNPGYQYRTHTSCTVPQNKTYFNYSCNRSNEARCDSGYYGTDVQSGPYSGCTACPADTSGVLGTSAAGSQYISNCYIPAGTTYTDSTGTRQYTSACYYTN